MDRIMMLDAVRAGDEAAVGVKAAFLGELLAAGFRVPAGFVMTVDAREAPGTTSCPSRSWTG
jgi:phosphoenolpyruvate synthase/pyruvate phosphate dikinase